MGKKIDRFMLTIILSAVLFFYFESVFGNRIPALIASVFVCMLITRLLKRIFKWAKGTPWMQKQNIRRHSKGVLMEFACMEKEEALVKIEALIKTTYGNNAPVELELLHPSTQLTSEKVFEMWRKHRNEQKLVICTTGKCPSEVRIFASGIKAPQVAVVDGTILSQLIAEHPQKYTIPPFEKKRHRLRAGHIARLIFNRRNAPRGILFSFSMLVMYVLSGNLYYLIAALVLLFTVMISLRKSSRPAKLF